MKVVLFCGGYGLRMREGGTAGPKPMALIGDRPVLWHVMRYYAHFGHQDFILCLGYGAEVVKDYFLNYEETRSNDFVIKGRHGVQLMSSDIVDWHITFVDTGLQSSIGERLRRVSHLLADEDVFLANYGDVLTDASLPEMVDRLLVTGSDAILLAVPPEASFHVASLGKDARVDTLTPVNQMPIWVNGGYFVMRSVVLEALCEGGDLVDGALSTLAARGRVRAHAYTGFWAPMDTLKDQVRLNQMFEEGNRPWALWERSEALGAGPRPVSQVPPETATERWLSGQPRVERRSSRDRRVGGNRDRRQASDL